MPFAVGTPNTRFLCKIWRDHALERLVVLDCDVLQIYRRAFDLDSGFVLVQKFLATLYYQTNTIFELAPVAQFVAQVTRLGVLCLNAVLHQATEARETNAVPHLICLPQNANPDRGILAKIKALADYA